MESAHFLMFLRYKEVFEDGLGRFTGERARLRLRPGAEPVFCRARPLPYALRARVDAELDAMLRAGVIEPVDHSDWATPLHPSETPPPTRVETREERLERRRRERAEQTAYKLEQEIALWDPAANGRATTDPFKTLFVARINYDTSESKLRREFEGYGPIKKIYMIYNKENDKPRGYAFIEYEHERDMHSAYKHADGKKIDGKRVLVDVERARTVKGWLPRRLGGGLGGTRRGGADVNIKHSGREDNERERERYRLEQHRDNERRRRTRSRSRRRSASRSRRRDRDRTKEDDSGSRRRRRSRSRSERRGRARSERRERKRTRRDKERKEHKVKPEEVKVKQEPADDYPEFSLPAMDVQIKQEPEDENKYNPEDANGDDYEY